MLGSAAAARAICQAAATAAKLAAAAAAKLPQPRCRCLHRCRAAAAYTIAALPPSPPPRSCQAGCRRRQAGRRLQGAAAALPPPPLPFPSSSSSLSSSLLSSMHSVDCRLFSLPPCHRRCLHRQGGGAVAERRLPQPCPTPLRCRCAAFFCCYLPLLGDVIWQSHDVSQLCVPMSFVLGIVPFWRFSETLIVCTYQGIGHVFFSSRAAHDSRILTIEYSFPRKEIDNALSIEKKF